ncbi:hypothetical protein ANN_06039 [Periplaneta americana]|uniref:Uncharacterized protein n=1 Tax=Periplaneta americana TaxID=6978 RepID=A0ABQ8TDD2_PERAM|nr:hypothetical protein ANN_06039 [Periplaneta americana]
MNCEAYRLDFHYIEFVTTKDHHPKYKFEYAVHDPHTGDVKEQWESRDGDAVKGSYSLKEADGGTRTVEYHADKHNGFIAVVKKYTPQYLVMRFSSVVSDLRFGVSSSFLDDGDETVVFVGVVLHGAGSSISFLQTVRTLHCVSIPGLPLFLDVTGMWVMNCVLELVLGMILNYEEHPQYKFEYAVHDPHTGDVKEQWESRDGDAVKGSYNLKEADGGTRTVEYHADKHNGFVAVVKKAGGHSKPKITYHGAKPHY